jgi:hypothetical protein
MSMKADLELENTDSKSFFNAYIPVVALLLAFFIAMPRNSPRFLSPDEINQVSEQVFFSAKIPLRVDGTLRTGRKYEEVLALARMHNLSAAVSLALPAATKAKGLQRFLNNFSEARVRISRARTNPMARVRLMTVHRLYD